MTRIIYILLFATAILFLGCQTGPRRSDFSPEAWAAWQKCLKVKEGMTQSQVYAIVPSSGRFGAYGDLEQETWRFGGNVEQDCAWLHLLYGKDGRVMEIDRSIDHGIDVRATMPHLERIQ